MPVFKFLKLIISKFNFSWRSFALLRLLNGAILVLSLFEIWPDFRFFYGSLVSVSLVFIALIASAFLYACGYFVFISGLSSFVLYFALIALNKYIINFTDYVVLLTLLITSLLPSSQYFSVDKKNHFDFQQSLQIKMIFIVYFASIYALYQLSLGNHIFTTHFFSDVISSEQTNTSLAHYLQGGSANANACMSVFITFVALVLPAAPFVCAFFENKPKYIRHRIRHVFVAAAFFIFVGLFKNYGWASMVGTILAFAFLPQEFWSYVDKKFQKKESQKLHTKEIAHINIKAWCCTLAIIFVFYNLVFNSHLLRPNIYGLQWHTVVGFKKDGHKVNMSNNAAPMTKEKPDFIPYYVKNYRWVRYFESVAFWRDKFEASHYLQLFCPNEETPDEEYVFIQFYYYQQDLAPGYTHNHVYQTAIGVNTCR